MQHFRDVEYEQTVLAADAIEFAETRLCRRDVNVEMHRLCTEAALELCYVPLFKIDPCKNKIAFNNATF